MTAKKFLRIGSLVMLMAITLPASSAVASEVATGSNSSKTENARAGVLMQRLEQIKAMDKSDMTRLEKKAIRKEVVEIKKEMKVVSGGVYLSVGAIIIVILLLILLL